MRNLELYSRYGESPVTVIREFGYPNRLMLRLGCMAYLNEQDTGVTRDGYKRTPKSTEEQKRRASSPGDSLGSGCPGSGLCPAG